MIDVKKAEEIGSRFEWKAEAKPRQLPSPTYWPFFLALGFAFLLWGLLVGWMIAVTGVVLIIISLTAWIKILRNEGRNGTR